MEGKWINATHQCSLFQSREVSCKGHRWRRLKWETSNAGQRALEAARWHPGPCPVSAQRGWELIQVKLSLTALPGERLKWALDDAGNDITDKVNPPKMCILLRQESTGNLYSRFLCQWRKGACAWSLPAPGLSVHSRPAGWSTSPLCKVTGTPQGQAPGWGGASWLGLLELSTGARAGRQDAVVRAARGPDLELQQQRC